jgi:hypothetical protein
MVGTVVASRAQSCSGPKQVIVLAANIAAMSGVVGIRLLYLAPGWSTRRHQHKRLTPRPTGAQSSARVPFPGRWRSHRLLERLNPLPGLLIGFGLPAFPTIARRVALIPPACRPCANLRRRLRGVPGKRTAPVQRFPTRDCQSGLKLKQSFEPGDRAAQRRRPSSGSRCYSAAVRAMIDPPIPRLPRIGRQPGELRRALRKKCSQVDRGD